MVGFFGFLKMVVQYLNNQKTKKDTPSVVIKEASPTTISSVNKTLTKRNLVGKKSAKKLQFPPEVEKVVRVPRTRVATKRIPVVPP